MKAWHHPIIAHDALLDRESEEQIMWPLHCFYLGDAPSSDAEKGSSCNPARFAPAFTDRLLLMARGRFAGNAGMLCSFDAPMQNQ